MAHIHYKFSSKLSYDTVIFDGPHITLRDLKMQIMSREKLRAGDCDLQITNAQSKEEYTEDDGLIPKGSSVIVRRVPIRGIKSSSSSKTKNTERLDIPSYQAFGASRAMDDKSSNVALSFFSKMQMANLVDADVSEEDKIKVMINQSCYNPMNFSTKHGTVLPDNYTCYRCGNTGHHIRNCPTSGDKTFEGPQRIKKSTGIPRSFMVEVDDPNIKGVMLTNCGRFAIPAIDAEAYAIGKKEKPPFVPQEKPKSEEEDDPIPDELLCLICHDLLSDSVVIPCCGNSYCDECIRTALLDSEDHVCPTCGQSEVSPDTLIANKFLRQAVNNFKKEQVNKSSKRHSGTSKSKNSTPIPSPVPTPPPLSLHSLVQKPLQSSCSHQVSKMPPLSQDPDVPPPITSSASADDTPNTFLQPAQSNAVISKSDTEGKTHDDSRAAASSVLVSDKDPIDVPSQLNSLLNNSQAAEQDQTVEENLWNSSLDSASIQSGSSTLRDSTSPSSGFPTGGLTESSTHQPSSSVTSSSSSYSTTPSPLFASPLFHTFIPTHQPHSNYPPGYQPTTPVWTLPPPTGAPIPSLCPFTSVSPVSALNPNEWCSQQRQRKERSPHRRSSHAKSSKSKSSRSYSRSTSRSGSRSRSRSRPRSSHSSNRDYRSRFHSSISHRYGYKRPRSPTPSSSSSSRGGYESRSNSSSDHQKSRLHSKGSASNSHIGKEKSGKEAGGSSNSQHTNNMSRLELDRQRYLQWTKEYQEWYEKYFSSYITHFHQLPLPPSPYPQDPRYPPPSRWMTGSMKDCSPSSESSSDSRSPSYKSSSDSHSTASHSLSDSCHSPPSHASSEGRASKSKDRATLQERKTDKKQLILKNVKNSMKHEQKRTKKLERGRVDVSCSSDSGDCTDDSKKSRKSLNIKPNARKDDTELRRTATTSDALEPVQPSLKLHHPLHQDYERKAKKETFLEREQGWRRGEDSDSMRRKHKIKHTKKPERVDGRREEHPDNCKYPDSLLENKRKGADPERKMRDSSRTVKPQKAETAEDPESREREPPKLFNRKKQNTEEKKEKKCSLTEKDIWEGGIKVMPHKKISININLYGKRKEEKTDQENSPKTEICSQETTSQTGVKEESCKEDKTETELNEKGESSQGNISDDKIKPDEQEERQMWKEVTCEDDKEENREKTAVDEKDGEKKASEKEDLWHPVLTVGEEESVMGKEEAERVRHDCREEMDRSVLTSQEPSGKEERPCRENGDDQQREGNSVRSSSPKSKNGSHHDGCNNTPDDGSCATMVGDCAGEESHEKKTVETHDENTQDHSEEIQNDLVLEQDPQSKWENNEEQDGEDLRVKTDTHTVAAPHPSEPLTSNETLQDNEQQRPRSAEGEREREKGAERGRDKEKQRNYTLPWTQSGVTPSSGRDRPDGNVSVDRNRETRTERHRDRERRDGERQKDCKRSKQETREEGRRRDWEHNKITSVQRRNPPSYSHTSTLFISQETERRHWQQRGGQCSSKSSPSAGGRGSSSISNPTNLPDQNASKTHRDLMSLDLKSKDNDRIRHYCNQGPSVNYRDGYKPARARHSPHPHSSNHRKDRDPLFCESLGGLQRDSPDWEIRQSKSRNESRVEKGERKPERVLKTAKEGKREPEHQEVASKLDGGSRREDRADKVEGRQRPSSSSSSSVRSSANPDNAKDKREKEKQHKYEKRHAVPELQEGEGRKHQNKKSKSCKDGAEEENGGEAGNR